MLSIFAIPVEGEYGITYELTSAGYSLLAVAMVLFLLLGFAIFGKKRSFSTKQLTFSAMAVALAMLTSMLHLMDMPMGGSVTLFSMLFITLIGYWYGLGVGLSTAIAYGILQLIVDPYIISFPQMIFDYVLAFGGLGFSGLFSKHKHGLVLGYLTGIFGRFLFATMSGVIFFATYASEFFNSPTLYSICYNGAYIGLEAVITLVLINLPPVRKALSYVKSMAV